MADLSDLVIEWASESAYIKQKFFRDHAELVVACAREMARRLISGGKLLTCGNGGSASDALHIAVEFTNPVIKERPPLPALALSADVVSLTSLANDFDYTQIFSRQVETHARPGDVLIGLTTSGDSANVLAAFEVARERNVLTIALTGKGGGRCPGLVDYMFAVPSHNILRIQETHLTLYHALWDMVHTLLHYEPELRRSETAPSTLPVAESPEVDVNLSQLYPFLFDR